MQGSGPLGTRILDMLYNVIDNKLVPQQTMCSMPHKQLRHCCSPLILCVWPHSRLLNASLAEGLMLLGTTSKFVFPSSILREGNCGGEARSIKWQATLTISYHVHPKSSLFPGSRSKHWKILVHFLRHQRETRKG